MAFVRYWVEVGRMNCRFLCGADRAKVWSLKDWFGSFQKKSLLHFEWHDVLKCECSLFGDEHHFAHPTTKICRCFST